MTTTLQIHTIHTIEEFHYTLMGPPLQQNWVIRLAWNFIQQFLKEFLVSLSKRFFQIRPRMENGTPWRQRTTWENDTKSGNMYIFWKPYIGTTIYA